MREGWEIKTIGEVCEIYNGGTPSTNVPEYWDGGIQWITPKDMGKSKEMYVSHCERTITQEGVEHSSAKVLPERSVIVSSRAPIGYVAINEVPMATNQGCKGFVLGKEIYPEFLYYFLLSSTELLNKLGTGATFKEVSGKKLAGIELPLPSLPEQQRIVDILDREFAKIDALKANAEKSLQAAKDLFLQILTETFSNPDWTRKRIGDVFDTGAGGTPLKTYKEYYENGDIPWLRSGEVCKKYIIETELFITQLGMDNSSAKMFPENSVVVAMYGATAGQVGILHLETTTNQAVCGIFPRKDYIPEFVYYSLLNSKKGLVAQATGNAQPNISQIKIKNTTIPVISKDKQVAVVSRLDDLNDLCNALQENYHKTLTLCDDLKQSLLRKAFNGEL